MINTRIDKQSLCDGCLCPLGPLDAGYSVCMACTRARHRAAVTHRCSCGRLRRPRQVSHLGRVWIACDRCLGTSRQIR
jgi:hypothetical protein